jgi:hypothetical protein
MGRTEYRFDDNRAVYGLGIDDGEVLIVGGLVGTSRNPIDPSDD